MDVVMICWVTNIFLFLLSIYISFLFILFLFLLIMKRHVTMVT